jgi:hypothetical protein
MIFLISNFWLRYPGKGWQRVSQFPVAIGEAKLIHNVQIHKQNSLTDVHLAIAFVSGHPIGDKLRKAEVGQEEKEKMSNLD